MRGAVSSLVSVSASTVRGSATRATARAARAAARRARRDETDDRRPQAAPLPVVLLVRQRERELHRAQAAGGKPCRELVHDGSSAKDSASASATGAGSSDPRAKRGGGTNGSGALAGAASARSIMSSSASGVPARRAEDRGCATW